MEDNRLNRREFVRNVAAGAAGVAAGIAATQPGAAAQTPAKSKILNYNENMEYRRLGKTELMVSAVCMGGHTGPVPEQQEDFEKNRSDVITRCMDVGINYIDACCEWEVMHCSKALKGRRDKMYLALSYYEHEPRFVGYRTAKKLLESLDELLTKSGQEYTDLWRITCFEPGGTHTFNDSCEVVQALETAKKQGKARFIGMSSHDRRWLKFMIEYFPQIEVVLFPYTSMSKAVPKESLFDALKKCDVGAFGIKPFAKGSLFKGNSLPDSPQGEADDRTARLAIRYILHNPDIVPIPGLSYLRHVDNVAKAVRERRELDVNERAELESAGKEAWAKLPPDYQWLKNWEYV
jgi:predicted aldo/keto reductase-like oxidoreductase